ncbi:hypothetical protein D1Z98_11260 [Riemerella anatipestifer]|uniref:hypothetical protein n=1 Tax=Riemerella anatipestifer TaxID=34085 RepID=UPI00129D47B4|nr:hypothetical protein [Riemerella anatipestifer]MDY3317752.1 hypothetical protein [Riemerella anatipestifer]MRM95499.1 hypothetical protein [Riemerella anatipestifer]
MSVKDFFRKFDQKTQELEQHKNLENAKIAHYTEITVQFVSKLKLLLAPYLEGLEERGFTVKETDHTPYYKVEVSNVLQGKTATIGTTHSPFGKEDYYYILSDFEEYGRQTLVIDESFPESRVRSLVENAFEKLLS